MSWHRRENGVYWLKKLCWRIFGADLGYEKRGSLLFLVVLRYVDYGTERYDLSALLNIIVVGHGMNRPRVIPRSLFEWIRDTRDVSAFMGAGPTIVGTLKGTHELLAKLPCKKKTYRVIIIWVSDRDIYLCKRKVRHRRKIWKLCEALNCDLLL